MSDSLIQIRWSDTSFYVILLLIINSRIRYLQLRQPHFSLVGRPSWRHLHLSLPRHGLGWLHHHTPWFHNVYYPAVQLKSNLYNAITSSNIMFKAQMNQTIQILISLKLKPNKSSSNESNDSNYNSFKAETEQIKLKRNV